MKRTLMLALATLMFALAACGGAGGLSLGGVGGQAVSVDLWSDVPRMDGLNASSGQLPMVAEMFMQMMVSQASEGSGSGDVAVFTTANTAAEIQAFYSGERMAASGWTSGDAATCFSGADQGVADIGLFCAFTRNPGPAETMLVLIAVPGEQSGQNSLFFVRLEGQSQ
jgi:hypothetical protein